MTNSSTKSSWLLWLGFGGLLCLLGFAGIYGLSTVKAIGDRNQYIRTTYLHRDQILQQIRADLYMSGTHIRDLLLEDDPKQAEQERRDFRDRRDRIRSRYNEYAGLVSSSEEADFHKLTAETHRYFEELQPTLGWTTEQRHKLGMPFMKDVLLPQRALVIQLADQLSLTNAHRLESGSRQVADLFHQFDQNLVVFTVGSLLAGAFLAVFTTRRLLRLEGLAHQQLQELQDLSSRLVQVQESERRAIARELHDEIGQSVSGLLLGIGNTAATLSREQNGPALTQLDDLRHLAERTVASVRNMSLLLRPSMLDDLGLVPALQWQAREVSRTANIFVQVSAETICEEDVTEDNKTCIYRLVQEALQNVARHAGATVVRISLSKDLKNTLMLQIEDNGRGFASREKGLGILGMEERVRQRNGSIHIDSEAGRGTTLLIRLPA